MQIRSQVDRGTTVEVSIPQKIVDETPGMVLENKEKLCTACYLRPERYKFPELRSYYNETVSHLAAGLELAVHRVFELEELKKLASIYQLTHLLIGREEYEEDPFYFEELAQHTGRGCSGWQFCARGRQQGIPDEKTGIQSSGCQFFECKGSCSATAVGAYEYDLSGCARACRG